MSMSLEHIPTVAIRTYQWDAQNELLARFYHSQGVQVVVVMDETHRKVNCGRWPKVSITREWIKQKQLYDAENIMWKSGDYCFYALREAFPQLAGFWLIEDEAVAFSSDIKTFLMQFEATQSDFMAGLFNYQNKKSRLYNCINYKTETPRGCSFGVTYMSARLIDFLIHERQKLTQLFYQEPEQYPYSRWATDEIFVMNYSPEDQFKLSCLTDIEQSCMTNSYFLNGKHHIVKAADYASLPIENRFYHPVILTGCFDPLVQIRHAKLAIKHKSYHEAMGVFGQVVRRLGILQKHILGLNGTP